MIKLPFSMLQKMIKVTDQPWLNVSDSGGEREESRGWDQVPWLWSLSPWGGRIRSIAHKYMNDAEQISMEVFQQWITGRGKHPVTWKTITQVFHATNCMCVTWCIHYLCNSYLWIYGVVCLCVTCSMLPRSLGTRLCDTYTVDIGLLSFPLVWSDYKARRTMEVYTPLPECFVVFCMHINTTL